MTHVPRSAAAAGLGGDNGSGRGPATAPPPPGEVANPSPPLVPPGARHTPWLERATGRTVRSQDGVEIYYEVLGNGVPGARTVVLANGLGARLYSWEPLVERLAPRFRIVTWDYRGLYQSGGIRRRKDLAIEKHAQDVRAILDAERVERATLIGWSMGVQVALEVATAFPERVERLVLINGTHGHALTTGLQPFLRLPWLWRYLHGAIEHACGNPRILDLVRRVARSRVNTEGIGGLYAIITRNPKVRDVYRQYIADVFGPSLENYLRLFQELDAHSAYHHLREISCPTLVVWGCLDPLTPASQSRDMARRIPGARRLHFFFGTHFVLLEHPERVVSEVESFLG